MKYPVGSVFELKEECLRNPVGTLGVVFNVEDKTGDFAIYQVIFENGQYDGFGEDPSFNEVEKFLKFKGISSDLLSYIFTNVIDLSNDYKLGVFDSLFKKKDYFEKEFLNG